MSDDTNQNCISELAKNFCAMALARSEKECDKDDKIFWFLLGYNQGKIEERNHKHNI